MTISRHKILKEIEAYLEPYGITIVNDEMMKRHRKVWITDGKRTAFITVSISPSDHRAFQNIAKSARSVLREAP
jgi:hypothetical protein